MTAADATIVPSARPRPPRWVMPVALVPIFTVLVAGWIAGASWAHLIHDNPLLLVALSPINRFLLLTTNELPAPQYYTVGLLRHLFPDPFFYLLGYWYGARALKWAAEGSPLAQRLVGDDGRGLENPEHRKILYPLAFLIPNNYVSLLCGSARIPIRTFMALNVAGTIGRLVMCRYIGILFDDEITGLATWIGRNQKWITVVSVVSVLVAMAIQLRPGGRIRQLTQLDEPVDAE